jgi:hypothetical protein
MFGFDDLIGGAIGGGLGGLLGGGGGGGGAPRQLSGGPGGSLADLLMMQKGGQSGSLADFASNPQSLNRGFMKGPWGPALFAAMAQQSPEVQQWANPEQLAGTQGVEQAMAGQEQMRQRTRESAAMMGLGRGFTSQADQAAQQAALNEVSGALLASRLLGTERRAMLEQMLMDALSGGSQSGMLMHAQHRASQPSTMEQIFGGANAAGGLLGGIGGLAKGLTAMGA